MVKRLLGFFLVFFSGLAAVADDATTLSWSTFLGGADNDYAHGIALDSAGRPVVTGYTRSADFPTTPGAYDSTHAGSYDVFVAKFSASGSRLLWCTFLGGSQEDRPFAIAIGPNDEVVVAGHTYSPDFPTTPGAFDRALAGGRDVFVAALDSSGSRLLWSTLLGGSGGERAWALVLGAGGHPILAGETSSPDFPATTNAFDTTFGGIVDGFVSEFDSEGRTLLWSTFLGGASSDWVNGLALDIAGRPIVVGTTESVDFPVTPGANEGTLTGAADAFVAELAPGGGALEYSTYLGGSANDVAYAVRVDTRGRAVLCGSTSSNDFPVTPGAFDRVYDVNGDIFVTRLETDGRLAWSTFAGGTGVDEAFALVLDNDDRPLVSGETGSLDFPTTAGAFDRSNGGNRDAYVIEFDTEGTALEWGSYLGGGQWESGWDFALDAAGHPLLTGPVRSLDFPTTQDAYDRVYNGGLEDIFVLRLDIPQLSATTGAPAPAVLSFVPNPFQGSLRLQFHLAEPGWTRLVVLDAAGRRVALLTDGLRGAGTQVLEWTGRDGRGNAVGAGVYWLRLDSGDRTAVSKAILLR